MCVNDISIEVPGTCLKLHPGDRVKLGRFSNKTWLLNCGWFSFNDNRPFWGMYLTQLDTGDVKPLLYTDLEDIYAIE